jgi:hypothetical protein
MKPEPTFTEIAPWIALALFGFTFFWCFVVFLISRLSGWAVLAAAYPATEVLSPSVRYRWQSAFMNANTKYNASIIVAADTQGVHFATFPIFGVGHAPFSVPWTDVRAEARQLMFVTRVKLTFARAPQVTMLVLPRLAERLEAASMGRFAAPRAGAG